jgi:tetratricopeptide (TPR) repeat protein
MTFFLLALLLQAPIAPADRAQLVKPAFSGSLTPKTQKDYDNLWKRFLSGKEDVKVSREFDKMLEKSEEKAPFLIVQSYIDLYAGRQEDAEKRLEKALLSSPAHPVALSYLAEFAYSRGDFVRAAGFFRRLQSADPSVSGIEMKSQRSLLLALETLVQKARLAAAENRLADAELLYRQALDFAPTESTLQSQLNEIVQQQEKPGGVEPQVAFHTEIDGLDGSDGDRERPRSGADESATHAEDDARRWGTQINRFHEIRASQALTREHLAALLEGYFPEIENLVQSREVMTDVDGSWAESAIRTVVAAGIVDSMANHTFQPSRTVTRGEFARALARLAQVLSLSPSNAPPITPLDVVPDSPLFRELQPVLGYGLLTLDNAGNFNVGGLVRGEEAVFIAEKLHRLLHKKAA